MIAWATLRGVASLEGAWVYRSLSVAAALSCGFGPQAIADELVAVKPGVMCVSTDALARLTLPNGDSRTHAIAPRPDDLAAAAAGGCIDIPPGARVQVVQAFRNTSRVIYAGPGAPTDGMMTVPNVDFGPSTGVAPVAGAVIPPGLAVARRLPAGGGMTLVLLQDARITPALQRVMEPFGGDPEGSLEKSDPHYREFSARPLRNGELLLQTADGTVIGRTINERPFAQIEPAPLHGLSIPTFLYMVDYSIGMGGFNGPMSVLLAPVTQGLAPLQATSDRRGSSETIGLPSTMHASWQIVPARNGGTEEIEQATCSPSVSETNTLILRTYRYHDGHWSVAARSGGACADLEVFPERRLFP